ncbi:hypothetical protein ACFO3D_06275 [Virgibacillus kekensis]|uniref:Uncharacterized protein n=1 Tax=Virgibacillus kekensis TaxID=202261 RepID=A0ABV9DHP4_9BACI
MKKPFYKRVWFWVIAIIIVIAINSPESTEVEKDIANGEAKASETSTSDSSNNPDDTVESEPTEDIEEKEEKTEPEAEEVVEETPQQRMVGQIVTLMDEGLAFDTGSYVKGDIPKGEYAFIPFDGSGKYYSETDGAGNIVDNEIFDSFGYVYVHGTANLETQGVLVNTTAFEQLGVSGAKELYEVVNSSENYQGSGMYKVGYDIKPNTYTIESMGEGYVAILSGPVGNNEIVDNNIFNGKYNVNVAEGQYLTVSKGTFAQ